MTVSLRLAVAFLGAYSLAGCGGAGSLPQHMQGVWTTSVERFSGRYFEITPTEIRFGAGADDVTAYRIDDVDIDEEPNQVRFAIEYSDIDTEEPVGTLRFYYFRKDATLRMGNDMQVAWRKTGMPRGSGATPD